MRQHFVFLIAGVVTFGAPTCAQAGFLSALIKAATKAAGELGEAAPKALPKATAPLETRPHGLQPGELPKRTVPEAEYAGEGGENLLEKGGKKVLEEGGKKTVEGVLKESVGQETDTD